MCENPLYSSAFYFEPAARCSFALAAGAGIRNTVNWESKLSDNHFMKRAFFPFCILLFLISAAFSQVPSALYGIWEGKDRIVFFEEAADGEGEASGQPQIVILLKEYYGWYYDRAVEPEDYAEKEERKRNSATAGKAQQIYFDVKNLKEYEGLYSAFELEEGLSRRQKNIIPMLISDDKIFLDFYMQDESDKNLFTGHSVSRGITMNEEPLNENISAFYLVEDGDFFYPVRYWKSDMDFEASKVTFQRDGREFLLPKHIFSCNQNYSCVSGRSKKIRNPKEPVSLESLGLKFTGEKASESPFLIPDKEPYLVRLADKATFDDLMKIVKEANSRRKPDAKTLFPPHNPPLDWHWDVIDLLERNNPYIQKVRERQRNFGARAKDIGR